MPKRTNRRLAPGEQLPQGYELDSQGYVVSKSAMKKRRQREQSLPKEEVPQPEQRLVPVKLHPLVANKLTTDFKFKHPCTINIIGASGSGKSTTLMKLLSQDVLSKKVENTIFMYRHKQSIYEQLKTEHSTLKM